MRNNINKIHSASSQYRLIQDGNEIVRVKARHAEGAIDKLLDMGYDLFSNPQLSIELVKSVTADHIEDAWDNWHPQFF